MNELKTESGLHLSIEKFDGKELIIRHGDALPIQEPRIIEIYGTIEAPRLFYEARKENIGFGNSHILVNRDAMSIILNINDEIHYESTITGTLQLTQELKNFKINSNTGWELRQFADFIRMNRAFFIEKEECEKLVTILRGFKAKITTEIEKSDTNKGDKRLLIDRVVKSEIPDTISLEIPVFKGKKAIKFNIELLVDTREVEFSLCLISPELQEYIQNVKDAVIDEEIKIFKDNGFAVIEV